MNRQIVTLPAGRVTRPSTNSTRQSGISPVRSHAVYPSRSAATAQTRNLALSVPADRNLSLRTHVGSIEADARVIERLHCGHLANSSQRRVQPSCKGDSTEDPLPALLQCNSDCNSGLLRTPRYEAAQDHVGDLAILPSVTIGAVADPFDAAPCTTLHLFC